MKIISEDKKKNIEVLLRSGNKYKDISRRVGFSIGFIWGISKKLGIKTNNKRGPPTKITTILGRTILRRFKTGYYATASQAARDLEDGGIKVSSQSVRNIFK